MQKKLTRTSKCLSSLALFNGLGETDLGRIATGVTEIPAARGTILFREGDACAGLHVVLSGQIKVSFQTGAGHEKVVLLAGEGESIGEAALFLGERYSVTGEAITDSMLLHVAKEIALAEVGRNAAFSANIIRELCRQLRQRTFDLQSCMLLSGTQRVIHYLLSQVPEGINGNAAEVALPARKGIIASRLNLTQEHFSRILHGLTSDALIEVDRRTIRIPSVGQLRAYTAG